MNEDNVQDETLLDGTAESSGSDSSDNIPDNNIIANRNRLMFTPRFFAYSSPS